MRDAMTTVLERDVETAAVEPTRPTLAPTAPTGWRPSMLERWLLPLMWAAMAVVAAIISPSPPADPPAMQAAVGEALGWIGLVAMGGIVLTARAGRPSLPIWSLALGGVTAFGLVACALFGHPVFSSVWGLTQVAMVTGGVGVSARSAVKRLG